MAAIVPQNTPVWFIRRHTMPNAVEIPIAANTLKYRMIARTRLLRIAIANARLTAITATPTILVNRTDCRSSAWGLTYRR